MSALSGAASTSNLFSAGALAVSGLATGLDTEKIIEGLLAIEQKRIENLQASRSRVQEQQTAFKGVEARLLSLQGNLSQLARAQSNVFDGRSVSSSHENLVTAAATSQAAPGVYQVQVQSLARAHQVVSQGFDSPAALITQGAFQLRVGNEPAKTITIDSGNNTLQGLASAINSAGAGVTAAIVNDGSSGHTQPYRLLLTSAKSGLSNAIVMTNSLAPDGGGAAKPVFDASYIGAANLDPGYTGTALAQSNQGAGGFTGTSNNTYRFTVLSSGTVGTDNNLQISYTDSTGANTGVVTLNAGDADVFKTVAQGLQVKFAAGTLVAGQTFSIKGFVPQAQAAADANVTIGSGAGALSVQSATNVLDGVFPGLTMNLNGANPGQTVTLTVANNVAQAKQAVQDFVSSYNDLMDFLDEQVKFDSTSNTAGPLLGNRQVLAVQEAVRAVVFAPVPGLGSQANRLSALGITPTDQGRLTINQSKLDDALAGRLTGVAFGDVRRLFALSATSSLAGLEFITGSAKTKGGAYQAVINQAAEQATIQGTSALAASTVISAANNTFAINVDGTNSGVITLTDGTYSQLGLAQEVQTQINASAALGGRQVTVGLNGDLLVITSKSYGSTSQTTIGAGTALASLGFAGTETDLGQSVAGHFLVNGQMEAATGSGQFLIGAATNANTADLQFRSTLTAAQVGAGVTADVVVTRGIASAVDLTLASLLDPVNGRLNTVDDGYDSALSDLDRQIARQNEILESRRASLVAQFVALERTVSELQGLGNFLNTQLSQINALSQNTGRRK